MIAMASDEREAEQGPAETAEEKADPAPVDDAEEEQAEGGQMNGGAQRLQEKQGRQEVQEERQDKEENQAKEEKQEKEEKELRMVVKYGQHSHVVSMGEGSRVGELMDVLQGLTNIHPRQQKLIHKGKILTPEMSFGEAKMANNSKLMLMAIKAPTLPPGLLGPVASGALGRRLPGRGGVMLPRGGGYIEAPSPVALAQEREKLHMWERTGIVSYRDHNLQVVPGAVWVAGAALRVLDLGNNMLRIFPPAVTNLVNLQRLRLSSNALSEHTIAWEAFTRLPNLTALALDHNQISMVPSIITRIAPLKRLSLSHNALSSLPQEIGQLSHLEWIDVAHNRIAFIPPSLADCSNLAEANFSANFIGSVPPVLGRLSNLKILLLSNNAVRRFPAEVLRGCSELHTLSLHGNPITIEQLQQVDGWEEFDARRRAKYSKRLELQALASSNGFDEGADAHLWHNW